MVAITTVGNWSQNQFGPYSQPPKMDDSLKGIQPFTFGFVYFFSAPLFMGGFHYCPFQTNPKRGTPKKDRPMVRICPKFALVVAQPPCFPFQAPGQAWAGQMFERCGRSKR